MKFIFSIFFTLSIFQISGQTPIKFYTVFGGDGYDYGYDVKQTLDNGYIIAGSTSSSGKGNTDVYLIKTDSVGHQVWYKTYGNYNNDIGKAVIQLLDSGYVITGYSNSFGNGGYDAYVIRTDKKGVVMWEKTFGGFDWDFANDLVQAADGNIVVVGNTNSFGYGKSDGYLISIDINTGAKIWEKNYGKSENDEFVSIKLTSDGKYSIAGNTNSYGDINGDFWFFKVGLLGDSITSQKLEIIPTPLTPSKPEKCYDFMEDKYNKLIFCGSKDTSYNKIGKTVSYAFKTDLNGTYLDVLDNTGGASNDDKFTSVANSKNNAKFCFARKVGRSGYKTEISPFLTDFNFHYITAPTYGGLLEEEPYRIINTRDNGFVIIGTTTTYGNPRINVFMLKMDSTLLTSSNITGLDEDYTVTEDKKAYYNNESIYFNNSNQNILCRLYNYEGKMIEEGLSENNSYKIKTPVTKGIYLLSYSTDKTSETLKFLVE